MSCPREEEGSDREGVPVKQEGDTKQCHLETPWREARLGQSECPQSSLAQSHTHISKSAIKIQRNREIPKWGSLTFQGTVQDEYKFSFLLWADMGLKSRKGSFIENHVKNVYVCVVICKLPHFPSPTYHTWENIAASICTVGWLYTLPCECYRIWLQYSVFDCWQLWSLIPPSSFSVPYLGKLMRKPRCSLLWNQLELQSIQTSALSSHCWTSLGRLPCFPQKTSLCE